MGLSTSVEISEAFEEHVVRGDDLSDMGVRRSDTRVA